MHKLNWGLSSLAIILVALSLGASAPTTKLSTTSQEHANQSSKSHEIPSKEEREWYERGIWPWAGPTLALILTNVVTIWIVYLQSSRAFNALLRQRSIERLSASLSEFYDPLIALIEVNGEIFAKTGPRSFPSEEPSLSAAALVWIETKQKILANNRQIEAILTSKTHLMHKTDLLDSYHELLIHVAMYETFQKIETEVYKRFLFPSKIRSHVLAKRTIVLEELDKGSGGNA